MESFEFNVDEKLRPSVERTLTGTTTLDTEISALPLPMGAPLKKMAVLALRKYRNIVPFSLRNRCVFEPSCSHYSELAIRQHGLIYGFILTINRLNKCKCGNGGVDLSNLDKEIR